MISKLGRPCWVQSRKMVSRVNLPEYQAHRIRSKESPQRRRNTKATCCPGRYYGRTKISLGDDNKEVSGAHSNEETLPNTSLIGEWNKRY